MDKAELRATIRAQPPVSAATSGQVAEAIFSWLSRRIPGTVTAFLAMEGEVDLGPLFERLPGWRWVLPRVEADRTMTFRDRDSPRELHRFGMMQPSDVGPSIPLREIDIFLTPGLAFDLTGGRLGNGGGFYDRVLVRRRSDSVAVGVTIDSRLVDGIPMEEHDQRVDWVASESGVVECRLNRSSTIR